MGLNGKLMWQDNEEVQEVKSTENGHLGRFRGSKHILHVAYVPEALTKYLCRNYIGSDDGNGNRAPLPIAPNSLIVCDTEDDRNRQAEIHDLQAKPQDPLLVAKLYCFTLLIITRRYLISEIFIPLKKEGLL